MRPAALGLLLLAFVGACGADGSVGGNTSAAASEMNVDSPVVAHSTLSGAGNEALVGGLLAVTPGCLLVGEYPVIWPYGTTWDEARRAVLLPDGQVVESGDRVSGGGGYQYLSDLSAAFADPLAGCPTNEYGEVAMFNSGEQITVTK